MTPMFRILPIFFTLLFIGSTPVPQQQKLPIRIKKLVTGLMGPIALECPKDGTGRLFVCEQTGKIKIIKNGIVSLIPFIDIGPRLDKVNKGYSEKGLLGMAFHPKYKSNGRFFLNYSAPSSVEGSNHKTVVAEFKVSSNKDVADPVFQKVHLTIEQPESNHNGGQLAFGPDGYLYIGSGDGGGAGDDHGKKGNGQDCSTLLGKILRIDVDSKDRKYPADNPFINKTDDRPEIWAYGLRNPWRFSFDRKTGELFCADVGQNEWEEIDIIEKGKNYGWRIMEGNHCYDPEKNCKQTGLALPIAEYPHSTDISITGGYVYRGNTISSLKGKYIFGEWKGTLFYLEKTNGKWKMFPLITEDNNDNDMNMNINSFGEDEKGEIYILMQESTGLFFSNGSVYVITNK